MNESVVEGGQKMDNSKVILAVLSKALRSEVGDFIILYFLSIFLFSSLLFENKWLE